MQTIRIYARRGGKVAQFTGIPGLVETQEMRDQYPEYDYVWLR